MVSTKTPQYSCGIITNNKHFMFGHHMGPFGANMGTWGPGIRIGIGPLNFCQHFEWKNDITFYCRTKTEMLGFGPLWNFWGPLRDLCGPIWGPVGLL